MKKQIIKFSKMQGLGNDYVFVNCIDQKINNPSELSKIVSDRHFGIGSDGLILIKESKKAHYQMQIFNADGSEAEMCGNGIRCLAKYVYDKGLTSDKDLKIETGAGILQVHLVAGTNKKIKEVEVDMGEPVIKASDVPIETESKECISHELKLEDGVSFDFTGVSMGNPHAVIFVEEVENFPVEKYGTLIENNILFPNKTNVEFVKVLSDNSVEQRTWERGSGETLACGTGACATVVAGVLAGHIERKSEVNLRGGTLYINWDEKTNHIFMRGPAVESFSGEIEI